MADKHMPPEMIRVTDVERRSMVEQLGRGVALGCLTTEEFEHRAGAAWSATTRGELASLATDLPDPLPALSAIEPATWGRRALPILRVLTVTWTIVSACSLALWGLLALSGNREIAAAWWVGLAAAGVIVVVPLCSAGAGKGDPPRTP